jgi:hypothetical protein
MALEESSAIFIVGHHRALAGVFESRRTFLRIA